MNSLDTTQIFLGRTDVLQLLKRRVSGLKEGYRQNVAVLGGRHMGKSALLQHFMTNVDDDTVTPVYLDLENKDFSYCVHKMIGGLLYAFSRQAHLPLYDDVNLLIESTKRHIPHTIQVVKKIQSDYHAGKIQHAFLGLLALSEVYSNETNKFCVLILDEFQTLEEFGIPEIFQLLGKKIMTQKRCFYIVASSYASVAKKILSEKLSLLFGNFEVVTVEPFDAQVSQDFVTVALADIKMGVQLRSFIADFTGGHPLYLQLICQEIRSLSAQYRQSEMYLPLLSQAVENTIFNQWGVISRHFELVINELCAGKGNRLMALVMIAIANGRHKVVDIVEETGIAKAPVAQRVNRLTDEGVLVKNGNYHYFRDKLLRYWVKYVYQKRLKDVELSPDKQRRQFKDDFFRSAEDFRSNFNKDFSARIVELFHCFDNEAFQINGKRYKLPVFRTVNPSKITTEKGTAFDVINAQTDDEHWLIGVKKDNFGESDVNAVISASKGLPQRPQRCVIVSLSDLDASARVRALQEQCWVWTEGELNTLLTLFDKSNIL